MTVGTLFAGIAIVGFSILLAVTDKEYEEQKDKFENS